MQTAVEATVHAIAFIMQAVPIGTNVGLARILWVMLNGSFLLSRGAVMPALNLSGFNTEEIRRSWAALRYGSWSIREMLELWQIYVAGENQWRPRRYEGYRVLSVDITGFWRPKLKGWVGKHYHNLAQKALPAVVLGVMIVSGEVGKHRIPLLQRLIRCQPDLSKAEFQQKLLEEAKKEAASDQVIVLDAGFKMAEVESAALQRYVIRLAKNATARRNQLPEYKGIGTYPEYGEKVRPLARTRKKRIIEATAPDHESQFEYQGRTIKVSFWHDLVSPDAKVDEKASTFSIYVYDDPFYTESLVLATDLTLAPATAYLIYKDRWPVEQAPLAAKQMIGLIRAFVFAFESCFRLPELALLAGNILTYVAAVLPPFPTGFWDRTPKSTPGRLRRVLAQAEFPILTHIDPELRQKHSVTDHLLKGVNAHRRQKSPT